jgi:hypothetical protein
MDEDEDYQSIDANARDRTCRFPNHGPRTSLLANGSRSEINSKKLGDELAPSNTNPPYPYPNSGFPILEFCVSNDSRPRCCVTSYYTYCSCSYGEVRENELGGDRVATTASE